MTQWLNEFSGNGYSPYILLSGVAVILLLILVTTVIVIAHRNPHWQIKKRLKGLGAKIIKDVKLPDGVDGDISIDYLLLTDKGILVVDVNQYDGLLYGNEDHEQWTQVVRRKNYVFQNPLLQMGLNLMAVKAVVPDAHVEGAVLFAGQARFPSRVPQGVLMLDDIPRQRSKAIIPENALLAWRQLDQFRRHYQVVAQ